MHFQDQCSCRLFFNGDIRQPEDAAGLENIMLGRGLLANPLLPMMLRRECTDAKQLTTFHDFFVNECVRLYQQPLLKLKLLWDYFLPETAKKTLKAIRKATSLDEYMRLVSTLL